MSTRWLDPGWRLPLPRSWAQMARWRVPDGVAAMPLISSGRVSRQKAKAGWRIGTCSQKKPRRSGAICNLGNGYRLLLRVLIACAGQPRPQFQRDVA
jgi:hypothetical protein